MKGNYWLSVIPNSFRDLLWCLIGMLKQVQHDVFHLNCNSVNFWLLKRINLREFSVLFLFLFMLPFCFSQELNDPNKAYVIEQLIELISENQEDEDIDFTTLFDDLSYYYDNPLDLNTADKESLEKLNFLNDFEINKLLFYRKKNGQIISLYELAALFPTHTVQAILPFVGISTGHGKEKLELSKLFKYGKDELFMRIQQIVEEQEGYSAISDSALEANPNNRYLGNPVKLYARYRYRYRDRVSFGITGEKDAGEEFLNGHQKNGFDYYSAHLFLKDVFGFKHLAVGDYQLQIGQGLTFWSGRAFNKSADAVNIKKSPSVLRPYVSADENNFLRGGAATYALDNISLTAFYSHKSIDANLTVDTSETDEVAVSSLQISGFHRTPAEIEDAEAIKESYFGGHLKFKSSNLSLGVTAVRFQLEGDLNRNLRLYNQFEFSSNQNTNLGFNYNYLLKHINFFGEVARSESGGMAYLNGALIKAGSYIDVSVLHRNYQKEYQNIHANGFSESSNSLNEQGLYLGFTAKPAKYFILTGYYDQFRFPWLRFRVDAPSTGVDYLAQLTYTPSRKIEMYVRYKNETKSINEYNELNQTNGLVATSKQNIRFNVAYALGYGIKLKSRFEKVILHTNGERETGSLIFQDIFYRFRKTPLSVIARYALFSTASYDSRIYAYENDVLYAFSVPAYSDVGNRSYLVVKYSASRKMDFWLKLSRTNWKNGEENGSGLNVINSPNRTEVKAQMRLRF